MSKNPFRVAPQDNNPGAGSSGSPPKDYAQGPAVYNNNANINHLYGSGSIYNNNHNVTNYVDARPPAPPAQYISDISVSATLPAKPIFFHGRSALVNSAVRLLTALGTARIAILGSGGMGKTTVALAILHESSVVGHFGPRRFFLSCEALVDVDAVVVSLAKLLGLPASGDLLSAVVDHLTHNGRSLLVLDNLETVWLAMGVPVAAVDELLGRLAQIPSLSLIVTCRGNVLSQLVEWSNADSAILEPFSLEAALQTFQDRAGYRLAGTDEAIARQLLNAVDRMPLAVSLLGQLAQRGNPVSELLERWNRESNALLSTFGAGRLNNVDVSVEISISILVGADDSQESLQLLSVCSMLPDGLHPGVFEKLRPLFMHIDRARDILCAYALATCGVDRTLKLLSPVRHFVSHRHPAQPMYHEALLSIYFDIAAQIPQTMDENFQQLADVAGPELGNLASLLLTLVGEPTQQVVDAVLNFTGCNITGRPTTTLASALLPWLGQNRRWRAACMRSMGRAHRMLDEYQPAIDCLSAAVQLYLELNDRPSAAWCMNLSAQVHVHLGDYDVAEILFRESHVVFIELGDQCQDAACKRSLGELMRLKGYLSAAVEHLQAARQIFNSIRHTFDAAQCADLLGIVFTQQGSMSSAATELENARRAFKALGIQFSVARNARYLARVRRMQGNFAVAEALLSEAQAYSKVSGRPTDVAGCELEFAYLRRDQGYPAQAIAHFQAAFRLYDGLGESRSADECRRQIYQLQSDSEASLAVRQ